MEFVQWAWDSATGGAGIAPVGPIGAIAILIVLGVIAFMIMKNRNRP